MVNFQGGSCHVHSPSSHLHHTSSWKLHFPVFLLSLHLHSLGDHLHLSLISMPIRTWIKAHTSQSLFFFFLSGLQYGLLTRSTYQWNLLVIFQLSSCETPTIFLWYSRDLLVKHQWSPCDTPAKSCKILFGTWYLPVYSPYSAKRCLLSLLFTVQSPPFPC